MTPEQIQQLNDSIMLIKNVCITSICCVECPMNDNCNNFPKEWDVVKEGDLSGK